MQNKKLRKNGTSKKRDLVAAYARGNVGLQIKRFVTAEEKESRKKRILKEAS